MKFKDIIYALEDSVILPNKMGMVAIDIYEKDKTIRCYEESITEVKIAMELCNHVCPEDDFDNVILDKSEQAGFYKKYVHFFIVWTKKEEEVSYIVETGSSENRTWINGKLAVIGLEQTMFTIKLAAGMNVICVEHKVCKTPYIRIENLFSITSKELPLGSGNYWYKPYEYEIEYYNFLFHGEPLEFKLIPIDVVNISYDKLVQMQIKSIDNSVLYVFDQIKFGIDYSFDLSDIPNMKEDEYECLYLIFIVDGIERVINLYRYSPNPQYTQYIKSQAMKILEDKKLPDIVKRNIEYCLYILNIVNNHTYYGSFLKEIVTAYSERHLVKYLYKPGPHNIFYYSDIDANFHYYYVVLPKDFTRQKSYPLILTISHGYIDKYNHKNYSYRFINRPGAIYADIGGVGNNFGSYLGEAFIKEEINHILNHFPIDSKRIYVMGNCGGNWAVYNFLQRYPDMFAGAYTILSHPDMKRIKNIYNINWIHTIAISDDKSNDVMQSNMVSIERNLKDFKFLPIHKLSNSYIARAQFTEPAIKMLMSKSLTEYPEKIFYRTSSNRSRKAYYIEIESIENRKDFAEFSSQITPHGLVIKTKNCTGLKIELPPQVNRQNFTIRINGKLIKFEKYKQEVVYLKHTNHQGFRIVDKLNDNIPNYKGAGLLDVYLSPMRIINCCTDNAEMTKVANAFSHPVTNTFHPDIYVDYPIYATDHIGNCKNYSLIVIDSNQEANTDLALIRAKLPIKMNTNGYSYKGNFYNGKYCIMQVIASPWDNDKSILYINTNDVNLYKRNLFTRTMIMPTYNSGRHPYLNGVALLFDGKKYSSLTEWH